MPNQFVRWSASGAYSNQAEDTTIVVDIATVPAMPLSDRAFLLFACAEMAADMRPSGVQYVRNSDGAVLGYGTLQWAGMPGTPFGGSLIGSIGGSGSPLGSDGGTFQVVAHRPAGPFAPPGDNGTIAACIVDGTMGQGNQQVIDTSIGPNGGTLITGACVIDEGWIAFAMMNCDHSQTPSLLTANGWESVITGPGNAIAVYTRQDVFEPCVEWSISVASTFCRLGMHVKGPSALPFGFAQVIG